MPTVRTRTRIRSRHAWGSSGASASTVCAAIGRRLTTTSSACSRLRASTGFAVQMVCDGDSRRAQHRRGDTSGKTNLQEYLRRLREGRYEIYTPWLTCCLAEGLATTACRTGAAIAERLRSGSRSEARCLHAGISACSRRDPGAGRRGGGRRTGVSSVARHGGRAGRPVLAVAHRDEPGASASRAGRLPEAREPLAATYGRFTEGFETLDLRTARALIAEIDAARRAASRKFTTLNSPGRAARAILLAGTQERDRR